MAAFSTSYKSVLQNDIRHMYSYKTKEPASRYSRQYRERVRPVTPVKRRYPSRFYDFFPRLNIGIPKAPAFREVDSEVMDEILERIRKPITCQSKSGRERCRQKLEPEEEERRKVSSDEMEAITKRLQKGTKCSQSRNYLRAGARLPLPPIKPRNSEDL